MTTRAEIEGLYLGIDIGTSSLKVVLIDELQGVVAELSEPLSISSPHPLWSEQHPDDWWQALNSAMAKLKKEHRSLLPLVRAIGLSGQMHGVTLLDERGCVLRPAILWNDGRASAQCKRLMATTDALTITGNQVMPGFSAPKVLWLAKHEPQIFNCIAKVLLPKDYIRYQLTGDYATDLSDASGTAWLDVCKRCWSETMLHATGLTRDQVPLLYEGNQPTGVVKAKLAKAWGLNTDVLVVAGGGDNAASAISMNVTTKGKSFISLGTSGVVFVATDSYQPNPKSLHTFCHCLPKLWHAMTVHLSACGSLKWLSDLLSVTDIGQLLLNTEQYMERHHDWHHVPIFLPYLTGERSPHNDPYARGVFFGLTAHSNRYHLTQAVLEGVAFALAQGFQAMSLANIDIDEDHIMVVGGGARSHYWGKILANVLNKSLCYCKSATIGAAFGAASLAWLGCHPDIALQQNFASSRHVDIIKSRQLDNNIRRRKVLFDKLYPKLKQIFYDAYHESDNC